MPTYDELLQLFQETRASIDALQKSQTETDKQIKQTNKQLGELGNRWGSYTEGLAYPSLSKVLSDKFKLTFIAPRARSTRKGHNLELDIFGYANDDINTAVVVEVKSRLSEENFQQFLNTLREFPQAFPDHAGKTLYGILAAVDVPENMKQRVLKHGIYLARISDETFRLIVPRNFKPQDYNAHPNSAN